MLFDSIAFLFIFLPSVWTVFEILCWMRVPSWLVTGWMIAVSLYFYGSVHGTDLLFFLALASINFAIGRRLRRASDHPEPPVSLLRAGVILNTACLIGFKYVAPTMPVGFSFFIFAQIGYLVDVSQGNAPDVSPLRYTLFSIWFPYILAGPIVKAEEVIHQFHFDKARINDLFLGLSYIAFGFFKKACLASAAAAIAVPFFMPGSPWLHVGALPAWIGALAFTLQIYFDFSGYSDMAIGAARLFGVRLPINFNSPLKAVNISEFWNRSHMTLTRFLMYYIYNPLALAVTRARAVRQTPGSRRGSISFTEYLGVVAFPLIITMLIAGAWHGANWTFVVFGLMHGIYLAIVHGWHLIKTRSAGSLLPRPLSRVTAHLITLSSLATSLVFFGSPSCTAAKTLLSSMLGFHGFFSSAHPLPTPLGQDLMTLGILFFIVFGLPNSQEWLSRDEAPLIPLPRATLSTPGFLQRQFWQPRPRYAILWGAFMIPAIVAILSSPSSSGFIYFKF